MVAMWWSHNEHRFAQRLRAYLPDALQKQPVMASLKPSANAYSRRTKVVAVFCESQLEDSFY